MGLIRKVVGGLGVFCVTPGNTFRRNISPGHLHSEGAQSSAVIALFYGIAAEAQERGLRPHEDYQDALAGGLPSQEVALLHNTGRFWPVLHWESGEGGGP